MMRENYNLIYSYIENMIMKYEGLGLQ